MKSKTLVVDGPPTMALELVAIPAQDYAALDELAKRRGLTVAQYIQWCLELGRREAQKHA